MSVHAFGAFRPMQPVAREDAFTSADHVFEPKLDGIRALAYAGPDGVRLQLRSGRDATARYPEVTRAVRDTLGTRAAVLDGEICALDDAGVPEFARVLQRENARSDRVPALARAVPVVYYAFDLLADGAEDVTREPLEERKARLEELVADAPDPVLRYVRPLPGSGTRAFEACVRAGYEGVIGKRRGSPYRAGVKHPDWLKVKRRDAADLVVGAWTPGEGRHAGTVGALVVGAFTPDGGLVALGRVGSGFTDAERAGLHDFVHRTARATSPFVAGVVPPNARFVDPRLVIEVAFHEVTRDGRLRAPRFVRARTDKRARECTLEGELGVGVAGAR